MTHSTLGEKLGKLNLLLLVAGMFCYSTIVFSDSDYCTAVKASVEEAGFSESVTVTCEDAHAYISSDIYPDHEMMTGIVGSNEQVPVPAVSYRAPIKLDPKLATLPLTRDAALGVAVNGVPIYDYTAGGELSQADLKHHQAHLDTLLTQQLDVCGGHAGRGDDYHYHVKPLCMIEQMHNRGDDAIIGWAFDGYPIYGDNNPDGSSVVAGELDICNGQPDETHGYRYHTSVHAPYIVQCLMGEVGDVLDLPRVPPLKAVDGGRGLVAGRPPRGGVESLVFTESATGIRRMEYSYQGENYYVQYSSAGKPNCYRFETKTVTNDGATVAKVLCR